MGIAVIIHEKVFASPRPLPKISLKENWMKELGSEVAGGGEDSQQAQPKTKTHLLSKERPVESCVPVSGERLDQDKDADENVDADQIRTARPVKSGQSMCLFAQREEIAIGFRVSGLPQAVVKEAEIGSKVILIEKHFKPI